MERPRNPAAVTWLGVTRLTRLGKVHPLKYNEQTPRICYLHRPTLFSSCSTPDCVLREVFFNLDLLLFPFRTFLAVRRLHPDLFHKTRTLVNI
jgi:hypothetical protein